MTAIGTSLITYPFSFPRAPTFPMLRADAAIDAIWLVLTARSGQLPITLHLRSGRTFDGLAMYPCLPFNGLRRTREGSRDYLMPITVTSRPPPWLLSGWGCQGRRLSRGCEKLR